MPDFLFLFKITSQTYETRMFFQTPARMKNPMPIMAIIIFTGLISAGTTGAQEPEENNGFNVSADLCSGYVWRGTNFGEGPHVQPGITFVAGGLTLGVWGSFDTNGYSETDPYITYSFPFGLDLGLTDYYSTGLPFFETSASDGSHAFEINGSLERGGMNISAGCILNKAGGMESEGGDLYFQAGYSFSSFDIFAGAGDGWHTSDGGFHLCNLGIGTSKTIEVTDKFSIPVNGQIILNPERERLFIVVALSF